MPPWSAVAVAAAVAAWLTALVLVWRADRARKAAEERTKKKEAERLRLELEVHWFRLQYPDRDWYRETRQTVVLVRVH